MSHYPSGRLEGFLEDSLLLPDPHLVAALTHILEPQRQAIQNALGDGLRGEFWASRYHTIWTEFVESDPERSLAVHTACLLLGGELLYDLPPTP